jgi:hypothetical protein
VCVCVRQPSLLAQGAALAKEIVRHKQVARGRIWALMRPHVPKWVLGTALLMFSETLWGVLHSYTMSMPHVLTASLDAGTRARAARHCLTVGMAYLVSGDSPRHTHHRWCAGTDRWVCLLGQLNYPIDTLGDVLVDDVEAEVQLKLRTAVMATVLAQDREYFDAHQVGELQERLNRDTTEGPAPPTPAFVSVSWAWRHDPVGCAPAPAERACVCTAVARLAIAHPKAVLSCMTRILTNTMVLFSISRQLAVRALALPVPFAIVSA